MCIWVGSNSNGFHRNPQGSYAENLKIQSLRRAYQQAVTSPKSAIEQIWRDYNSFEQVDHLILQIRHYLYHLLIECKQIYGQKDIRHV